MLTPFKQSVGFQETQAVATLDRNQMRSPCFLSLTVLYPVDR